MARKDARLDQASLIRPGIKPPSQNPRQKAAQEKVDAGHVVAGRRKKGIAVREAAAANKKKNVGNGILSVKGGSLAPKPTTTKDTNPYSKPIAQYKDFKNPGQKDK